MMEDIELNNKMSNEYSMNGGLLSRRKALRISGSALICSAGLAGSGIVSGDISDTSTHRSSVGSSKPETSWQRTYRNELFDYFNAATEMSDGDYVFGGHTRPSWSDPHDRWLVKVTPEGTIRWSQTLDGNQNEFIDDVVQGADGSLLLSGYKQTRNDDKFGMLTKVTRDGEKIWEQQFEGMISSLVECDNGELVALGGLYRGDDSGMDWYLLCTDESGNKKWSRTYGGKYHDYGRSLIETRDGKLVAAGKLGHKGTWGPDDARVLKTDRMGSVIWDREFGSDYWNDAHSVIQTNDGGFMVGARAGTTDDDSLDSKSNEAWLIKLATNGLKEWSETYGPSLNDRVRTVIQTRDGEYAFAGIHTGNPDDDDDDARRFWVVKVGPQGTKRWSQTFEKDSAWANDLIETSDGDLLIAGYMSDKVRNGGTGLTRGMAVKLDVNDPPTAEFTVSETPMVGRPVTFSAAPSEDPDGSIGGYEWDLTGDGSVDARGAEVSYSYPEPGEYTVRLTVYDREGKRTSSERSIVVSSTPTPSPTPSPTASPAPTDSPADESAWDVSASDSSLLGTGAGLVTLTGALAWWRRRGED